MNSIRLPRHERYDYSPLTGRKDYSRLGDVADYCYTLKPGLIPGS